MNQEVLNLCILNLVQHMSAIYQKSDLYLQFQNVCERMQYSNSRSDLYNFILICSNHCITGKQKKVSEQTDHFSFSIFNLLYQNKAQLSNSNPGKSSFPYPENHVEANSERQHLLLENLLEDLKHSKADNRHVDRLLNLCEHSFSDYSNGEGPMGNYLSLSDEIKFTTALCTCFYQYLTQNPQDRFAQKQEDEFYRQKSLLLFSCDISGIQKFIYTVSGKGVLKSLRSRSFYIDILLEHVIDGVLQKLGFPYSNKLYSGGGRAYLLLANTENAQKVIQSSMQNVNEWLLKHFDISLYLAYACQECSAGELFFGTNTSSYRNIFASLSAKLSACKACRYRPEQIKFLNNQTDSQHGRECRICSRSDRELNSDDICSFCQDFIAVSPFLLDESLCIAILNHKLETSLPCLRLPSIHRSSTDYLYFLEQKQISLLQQDETVQIYHRKDEGPGQSFEMSTYAYTVQGEMATFKQLAEEAKGIQQIAVLRADVDNLGVAFLQGFRSAGSLGYHPLLLTAALSARLSLFFRRYLKTVVDGSLENNNFTLTGSSSPRKKLVVVYSGGDDLFLAGAWNDVVETAVNLRICFEKYTADTLTFSAGIGIFDPKYPLSAMAEETEKLVDAAKSIDESKNAVALFGTEIQKDAAGIYRSVSVHCYHWKDFSEKVVGEKFSLLSNYFERSGQMESANSNAFLYRLMAYISETQRNPDDRINIARFAYLLARLEPKEKNMELQRLYSSFSSKMYFWILNREDRRQLLTAITLYIYMKRSAEHE